jgi:hypothetical protein
VLIPGPPESGVPALLLDAGLRLRLDSFRDHTSGDTVGDQTGAL